MTVVFDVDPAAPDPRAVDAATEALRGGGLVILPTETVYGLAARPDDPGATARVFEAKGRPTSLNLPVLAADVGMAWTVGRPNGAAADLASAFWPGPLTVIVPRADRSAGWALGDRAGTVGLRVPDHALSRSLLDTSGPLAVTSANPSGGRPLERREELVSAFGGLVKVILALDPDAPAPSGTPSTVVDCTGPTTEVIRSGMIEPVDIHRILAEEGPLQDQ